MSFNIVFFITDNDRIFLAVGLRVLRRCSAARVIIQRLTSMEVEKAAEVARCAIV